MSRHQEISFEEFKENFIKQPDGFFPVYSAFEESDNGELLRILNLDMICEWRLTDGKVKFLSVPFETEEQFNEIVAYLKVTAELLNKAILKRVDELSYAETVEEPSEDEDDDDDEDEE